MDGKEIKAAALSQIVPSIEAAKDKKWWTAYDKQFNLLPDSGVDGKFTLRVRKDTQIGI